MWLYTRQENNYWGTKAELASLVGFFIIKMVILNDMQAHQI